MSARTGWAVVVPVKHAARGKSRLRATPELARALAVDTVAAAAAALEVALVLVVTDDPDLPGRLSAVPQAMFIGDPGGGLNAAVVAGLDAVADLAPRAEGSAVLLGDLPALRPDDLDDVLREASGRARAFVRDAEGTGTTLLTALAGHPMEPAFGAGSAAAHATAGYDELSPPRGSSIRRDVDTSADLDEARGLGVGPATTAVLRARSA